VISPAPQPPISPAPVPKPALLELTVRILHPGALWKTGHDEFHERVAKGVARLTAHACGGAPAQTVTVEVSRPSRSTAPQIVSGSIRELLSGNESHPASGIRDQASASQPSTPTLSTSQS
jgi:hypothetical protein